MSEQIKISQLPVLSTMTDAAIVPVVADAATQQISGADLKTYFTGDITFDGATISAPDDTIVRIQALDDDSVVRSLFRLDPDNGYAEMRALSGQRNTAFGTGDWDTGEWSGTEGSAQLAFTGATNIVDFLNNEFGGTTNQTISVNGSEPMVYNGWSGGGSDVTFFVDVAPPADPTTITSIEFGYYYSSRIEIDYDDDEINILGTGLNININSTESIDIGAANSVEIASDTVVSLLNNSATEPILIRTDNGNTNQTWEFGASGNLTVPGNIVGTTANNSGSLQWKGNSSGDGNGYTTLELRPDNTLISNDQYLIIDPTLPSHIHIRAGGTQDDSQAELYLGGEGNFVRVVDGTGVRLQNQTRDNTNYFYSDPGTFTTGSWYESSGTYFVEYTTSDAELVDVTIEFNNDSENTLEVTYNEGATTAVLTSAGSVSNLGGGVYRVSVNEAPPASPTAISAFEYEIWSTNNNRVELEGNDFEVAVADDVRITGANGFTLTNESPDEPIEIVTDNGGASRTWSFGANGTLETPGDVVVRGDVSGTSGASTLVLKADPNSNTAIQLNDSVDSEIRTVANLEIRTDRSNTDQIWRFDTNGVLTLPGEGILQSIDDTVTLRSINTGTGNANGVYVGTSGGLGFFDQSVGGNWLEIFRNNTDPQIGTTGNLLITTDNTNTAPTWTFDNAGVLTVPGNIVMATGTSLKGDGASPAPSINGFSSVSAGTLSATGNITGGNISATGNITAPNLPTKFTGSWSVPTGNSTQSFTVDGNNTYQMWVEGNIPNGIIAWNALVTVTNINVPVLGQQFAWNYEGGGNVLMFNSIPDQIIGTAGAISNVEPVVSNTNVFSFGINNASGNTITVEYGWVKLS
jgi:hypothetical protein